MGDKSRKLGNEPITTDSMNAGLTKREYFAALAMQSMVCNYVDNSKMAKEALACADALLEELSK